jgi:hypothetical protein
MQGLSLDKWYKGMVAGAIALMGVGAVAKDRPLLALAFGMLLFGLGAWKNHTIQTSFRRDFGFMLHGEREIRAPTVLGVLLEVIGALFMAVAGWKLLAALF